MKTLTFVIKDPQGMHVRPAGLFVKEAQKYESVITVEKNGKSAGGRKLMALMGLGAKCGDTLHITVEGPDEDAAAAALEDFLNANL